MPSAGRDYARGSEYECGCIIDHRRSTNNEGDRETGRTGKGERTHRVLILPEPPVPSASGQSSPRSECSSSSRWFSLFSRAISEGTAPWCILEGSSCCCCWPRRRGGWRHRRAPHRDSLASHTSRRRRRRPFMVHSLPARETTARQLGAFLAKRSSSRGLTPGAIFQSPPTKSSPVGLSRTSLATNATSPGRPDAATSSAGGAASFLEKLRWRRRSVRVVSRVRRAELTGIGSATGLDPSRRRRERSQLVPGARDRRLGPPDGPTLGPTWARRARLAGADAQPGGRDDEEGTSPKSVATSQKHGTQGADRRTHATRGLGWPELARSSESRGAHRSPWGTAHKRRPLRRGSRGGVAGPLPSPPLIPRARARRWRYFGTIKSREITRFLITNTCPCNTMSRLICALGDRFARRNWIRKG